ncbi:MAG: FAD-dependent 5-carboxymethylaminomethyl-2-thiouridine(34) oxidoreductase MnmC [Neisseria sp.]|nr:FAD-dependent 5-carboxymethylaminomethyl-2-thiouridine(34) oxidoreductase MnmC [Neisseria sp.]
MNTAIWYDFPPIAELLAVAQQHKRLAICLPDKTLPDWVYRPENPSEQAFYQRWQQQKSCVQFLAVNLFSDLLPDAELWLLPPVCWQNLADYFEADELSWQTKAIETKEKTAIKPWFMPSAVSPVSQVAVIGAGLAGAATAYALAKRGVKILVLEKNTIAHAASGNHQGLLYAKISAHATEQSELLLGAYGYTRRLIEQLLPDSDAWQACGVLHVNHDANETKRNAQLAQQNEHRSIYHHVNQEFASEVAGVGVPNDALFWQQGVSLNPPSFARALLNHANISVHENCTLESLTLGETEHVLHTSQGIFSASHIVFCTGADSKKIAELQHLPWQMIRGQTSLVPARADLPLKTALSGASYISPAWQGWHCYGASFVPHDEGDDWRLSEEIHNQNELHQLCPELAQKLLPSADGMENLPRGRAAIRCDSPDHLPTVGAIADDAALKQVYAKLALDKNYRLNAPCPYLPRVYVNAAHGSRGIATAPWCAEAIAAEILGFPHPFSARLRAALHPNRHSIRTIIRHSKKQANPL